jgi:thiosulfate/3-mercaptopyruvate sulfurtransferase
MPHGSDPLIATEELADRLGEPGLRVLDASWHLPGTGRSGRAEFEAAHIPGAVFFDIDAVSDPVSALPHMLPSAEAFGAAVSALGVSNTDAVVVYDSLGLFSAPRVWWMFRAMGHDDVRVLDGGLPRWRREGLPTESGAPEVLLARFEANARPALVRSLDEVRAASGAGDQVVDARPAARFAGTAPEPRPGLRLGHMPGARNLPFSAVLDADGGLRPNPELRKIVRGAGVDLEGGVTASCGSGVTAAVVLLALARLGRWDAALYDGSWAEWGGRQDTAVVTGDESGGAAEMRAGRGRPRPSSSSG